MSWLVISILLSVVLTVVLNAGLRLFPGTSERDARGVAEPWPATQAPRAGGRRVRVWMPWKAMILGSVMLTIVVNLVLWIARA